MTTANLTPAPAIVSTFKVAPVTILAILASPVGRSKMTTTSPTLAHRTLTTKHETMRWESSEACISIRKTAGRYVVRLEDYIHSKTFTSKFATLAGALVCADNLREYYL